MTDSRRPRQPSAERPLLMGILNVTPDSFSDGGRFDQLDTALRHVEVMLDEGVDIIDIGGESTRPGAHAVGEVEEIDRVVPVIEAIAQRFDVALSVDTSKALVMRAAVDAGAGLINDVNALRAEGALSVAAELQVPVCLMHMRGKPRTMQQAPEYEDVVGEVKAFLLRRVDACKQAGIAREKIWIDPGFGFGKTLEHNLELLRGLPSLVETGLPVLAGVSRKSMLGMITGREVARRLSASLAASLLALQAGAQIVRVHDVAETRDVMRVWQAVKGEL